MTEEESVNTVDDQISIPSITIYSTAHQLQPLTVHYHNATVSVRDAAQLLLHNDWLNTINSQ